MDVQRERIGNNDLSLKISKEMLEIRNLVNFGKHKVLPGRIFTSKTCKYVGKQI
jgi:hypothetical protein